MAESSQSHSFLAGAYLLGDDAYSKALQLGYKAPNWLSIEEALNPLIS